MAHEAGHLFYINKKQKFSWSKNGRSEEKANKFAIKLLNLNNIEKYEYFELYELARKKGKKRKKSWFEI